MKKTDFDTCHRPSFLFCYSYDALYTLIWVALMHVSPSFLSIDIYESLYEGAKVVLMVEYVDSKNYSMLCMMNFQ